MTAPAPVAASTSVHPSARASSRRRRWTFRGGLLTALTWIVAFAMFFPILWMVFTSLKSEKDAAASPPTFFVDLSFDRYVGVFERGMAPYLINSLTVSVLSTLFVLLLAIPAAYGLSIRPVKRWRDLLFFFISTRFMPVAASIIPLYLILKTIGGLDNITVLSVLYIGINLPIAIWMMRSFFSEVPPEIVEAARVDGAGVRTEIVRIVLPIVAPGLAAAELICFIFAWNEYFLATILTASAARTTPPFLGSFVDGRGQFLAALSAASTLAVLPVVIAGWVAQKRLVRGLAMGAVK